MKIFNLLVLTVLLAAGGEVRAQAKKGASAKDTTEACVFMKEVCDAARDFQKEYDAVAKKKQKKEMLPVLNSYIIHCEKAREDCSESVK